MSNIPVVFIQGGGAGHEQEEAVSTLFQALKVPVDFIFFRAGRAAEEVGEASLLPDELVEAVKQHHWALKTKILQPLKPTSRYINTELRSRLGLFASTRPVQNLPGLAAPFADLQFHLVREISEDLYATSEHEVAPGVVQSFKIVTETACQRFFQYAFTLTRRLGRKSIHCIHKANILKLADGLFLECFRRVALDFPDIRAQEMIVDNTCMQLVSKPHQFEVLAAGNLYGDLLSDLAAGLVGGISATSAINIGEQVRVYEAVFGVDYPAVTPGFANPLPLIMPALELLKDLNFTTQAQRLHEAVKQVLTTTPIRTPDLGGTNRSAEFTAALVDHLS